MVSAVISWKWTDDGKIRALLVAVIIVVGLAGYFVSQRLAERNVERFKWKTDNGRLAIRTSILRFLSQGQHAVIFTRDLSWANDEVVQALTQKASAGELTLCLPQPIALSKTLVDAGATAYYYGDLVTDAESFDGIPRFTLVRPNTGDSELAFGRRRGDMHYIHYSRDSADPALNLARDLFTLVRHSVKPVIKK